MLEQSQKFYVDFFSEDTHLTYDTQERYQVIYQLIMNLGADDRSSVLEIGSGSGRISQFLAQRFQTCVTIDIIQSQLLRKVLRQYHNLSFAQAALPYLPFPENSFDLVIFSEVLEHLETDVQQIALHDIARVLVPGGRCILSTPNLQSFYEKTKRALRYIRSDKKMTRGGQLVENYLAADDLRAMLTADFQIEKKGGSYYLIPPKTIFEKFDVVKNVSHYIGTMGWLSNYGLYQYYVLKTNKLQ